MELNFIIALLQVYNHSPMWENLHPQRNVAQAISQRLCSADLAERCKKDPGGVRVPSPHGPFLRLTPAGTNLVLKLCQMLPEELRD